MARGAHGRQGPPPDPNAIRRGLPGDAGWATLPADGRGDAPTPDWPLVDPSAREWDLWQTFWEKPQAVMWEAYGQHTEVAIAVRTLAEAEVPGAKVEVQKVLRQHLESLGLTTAGMLRHRWKIAPSDEAEGLAPTSTGDTPAAPSKPAKRSARERLRVVDSGDEQ